MLQSWLPTKWISRRRELIPHRQRFVDVDLASNPDGFYTPPLRSVLQNDSKGEEPQPEWGDSAMKKSYCDLLKPGLTRSNSNQNTSVALPAKIDSPSQSWTKALFLGMLTTLLLLPPMGCVRRRLTVRTNPPGAAVYVDKHPIGHTPVSVPFTYYGTRSIEVIRDGYRTEKVMRTLSAPWYQYPPIDFLAETFWPWEVRDERIIDVEMIPEPIVSSPELMKRAEELRLQAAQGVAVSLPPPALTTPSPVVVPSTPFPPASVLPPGGVAPPSSNSIPILPAPAPSYVPSPPLQSGNSGLPAWQPGDLNPGPMIEGLVRPGGQPPTSLPNIGIPGAGFRPQVEGQPSTPPANESGDWQDN
jgi:hypothetical protein